MSMRAIQEFVIHVESFRNIDLWYQGAYLIKFQLYINQGDQKNPKIVYAHPFAHTQNYLLNEQESRSMENQIIKQAWIDEKSSSFLTKTFILRYFEEEAEINDFCHFRIETDLSQKEQNFTLQVSLLFYDQQIKKVDIDEITLEKGKVGKTKKYIINNARKGIHEYIPLVFDNQYFSIANIVVHSICLDYRFRLCKLQLSEFSKLSRLQKSRLMEKNKKMQTFQISYSQITLKQLNLPLKLSSLEKVEDLLVEKMKQKYHFLLREYGTLFYKIIHEYEKKRFNNLIVYPQSLCLFEDEIASLIKSNFEEKLNRKYRSHEFQEILQKMLNETNLISGEMIKLWHYYIDICKISPRFAYGYYQQDSKKKQGQIWEKLRIVNQIQVDDICLSHNKNVQNQQKQLINRRAKLKFNENIQDQQMIKKRQNLPFFIENVYFKNGKEQQQKEAKQNSVELHLVVLVHGFQGNSLDMKLIKNNISIFYPEVSFLCATSNQQLTDTDIIDMGQRLSNQIKNHILQNFPPEILTKISFIGHSLGGVIIRAALPRLLDYKDKFYNFITFSSPHLGYKVNTSSVIQAGIWFLQKLKNSNCLKQLTMADNANPKQTCLYKISNFQGLKHFKNIFFFSSKQDSYAPYESARVQIDPQFMNAKDPLKQIHCEMVRNILQGVNSGVIKRINVFFKIEQTNIDSIIGRTAHILFLENNDLLKIFLYTHPELFS